MSQARLWQAIRRLVDQVTGNSAEIAAQRERLNRIEAQFKALQQEAAAIDAAAAEAAERERARDQWER